jgi:hypothetical protein
MTAPAYTTLMDIAKANGSDATTGLIDETISAQPEIRIGAARTIEGINYKTLIRTSLPVAAFRNANVGAPVVKSTYADRLVETFILNPPWQVDKAVADRYEDGPEAYIAMEAVAIVRAAMVRLAQQFYYGGSTALPSLSDPAGFPGLLASYDNVNMVVDAGGTTDNVASSVWAVKFGPDMVQWVYGKNGTLDISPVMTWPMIDANGNTLTTYRQELLAYPGVQVGNLRTIGRIKKITTDVGATLNDSLLFDLLELFPVGYKPDAFFMTRRSLKQLRQSRTAVNPSGQPAPIPTEVEGIPIYPTDSIANTETLAS